MMDWNWFFSSLAQSVAALVGIFAAFIITKIINSQGDYARKSSRLNELLTISDKLTEALSQRSFSWYSEHKLKHALDYLDGQLDQEEPKSPEAYYSDINFPRFIPRVEVLKEIEERIKYHVPKSTSRGSGSPGIMLSQEFIRDRAEWDRRFREQVDEEGNAIKDLILELRQHTRLVQLHLLEVEDNPESSSLITKSIIGAGVLFLTGVIYPLSFLPVDTTKPISLSFMAFFTILISLKGFFLGIVTLIFTLIMVTFLNVNWSLKYDNQDMAQLRKAAKVEHYSDFLRIMEANQKDVQAWLDKTKKSSEAQTTDSK
jgi:hypothetical protein